MLKLVGFGSMGVMAAFLIAIIVAVSGGAQVPLTQWAVPQAPATSGAKQNAQQAANRPFDHASSSSSPSAPANPGAIAPGATANPAPSASPALTKATTSAFPSSSATASPTLPGNGRGNGNTTGTGKGGNPHSSPSPTPTA